MVHRYMSAYSGLLPLPAVGPVVPPIDDISHGGWPGEGSGPPGIEYPPGETFGESSSEE